MCFKGLIVLFSLIFANYVEALKLNDECQLRDGKGTGRCMLADDCEPARSAALQKNPHELGSCGSDQSTEIVCCPITTPKDVLRRSEIECNEILKNSIPASNPVVGGDLASPGEFPFVVALGYEYKNETLFNCGGSIISKDYVLTEAVCLHNTIFGKPMVVRSGVTDASDSKWNNETDVGIADYILHPNNTKSKVYNDVALLRLSKPLKFSSNVRAVCLETNHDDPKGTLITTGWKPPSGWKQDDGRVLKKTNVTAISLSECSNMFDVGRNLRLGIVPEMVCAANPEGEPRSCKGDAGGPLLQQTDKGQHRLIGVTSFGKGCNIGIYMRVSRYLDWIESIVCTRRDVPCTAHQAHKQRNFEPRCYLR
ncbi:hypothetical protein K1T71_012459 [Dendrolimus kikuchii]|uniref:Uncharacterized protein n=1 Tax=Dendrolimus kikuchii TaxID=765133 RepID=A0ACC1CJT4_9NEOP|nr:hypothetical protein K1T71_012459 [Dendrolimus kikuchii]